MDRSRLTPALTPREEQVVARAGQLGNAKLIAHELGISPRRSRGTSSGCRKDDVATTLQAYAEPKRRTPGTG